MKKVFNLVKKKKKKDDGLPSPSPSQRSAAAGAAGGGSRRESLASNVMAGIRRGSKGAAGYPTTGKTRFTALASGEIDIVEVVNLGIWPNEIHGTLHYGLPWPQWENHGQTLAVDYNPADDYHVYAVEWEADEIRWYVDGEHYQTQSSAGWYNYIWQGQGTGHFLN